MIVAIDGPAGSGKSSVAKRVASERGLAYLDTGALFRCVTLLALRDGTDLADGVALAALARSHAITFGAGGTQVLIDGEDVSAQIRTPEVDASVSQVAAHGEVRDVMVELERGAAAGHDIICDGRDMGTVVFPHAELKIFLDASPEVRARRRAVQRAGGDLATHSEATVAPEDEAQILAALRERDAKDRTREVAPLKVAEGAQVIDTSEMDFDAVVARVEALIDATRTPQGDGVGPERRPEPPHPTAHDRGLAPMRPFRNSFDDYYDHGLRHYPRPSRLFYEFVGHLLDVFTRIVWPWSIDGEERFVHWLSAQPRGIVMVMNHEAMIEPIMATVMMWRHGFRLRAIYKGEFNRRRLVQWVFTRVGGIPVLRGSSDMRPLRRAQHALERQESIIIFPEGTRVTSDDQEVELHGGFALMAKMAKTYVVPVGVVGARHKRLWVQGPHRRHLFYRIGEPISFDELGVRGRRAQLEAMETLAMERVYALRDELRAEHPGLE